MEFTMEFLLLDCSSRDFLNLVESYGFSDKGLENGQFIKSDVSLAELYDTCNAIDNQRTMALQHNTINAYDFFNKS
jgi:hypothetical protein